jgi:hypothetical protein
MNRISYRVDANLQFKDKNGKIWNQPFPFNVYDSNKQEVVVAINYWKKYLKSTNDGRELVVNKVYKVEEIEIPN